MAKPRAVVLGLSLVAALLSAGYVVHYLRGGPRIIDATSYYLEARALARGALAFPTPLPSGSFRGRFLVTAPDSALLSVLFPPGYPALLAFGFAAKAPLAVGPVLGGLIVVATARLAHALTERRDVALVAAGLSVLSAALRYHTADTMSHGLAAVLLVLSIVTVLLGGRALWVGGLLLGWLIATRPITGAVGALFIALLCLRRERRELVYVGIAALPGIALLLAHQRAATGSVWGSSQLAYYALADGPPGCFRYGFGQGIGCLHEHGDFVRHYLPNGFGLFAALGTSWRRLWSHSGDIANLEIVALILPWAAWVGRKDPAIRLLAFVPVALVFAYAPFYFDGNYPGGGARLLAEALPFEHVLLAWALLRLKLARLAPAVALAGFAVHASRGHEALAGREGGRPMFEPSVVRRAGVFSGLVLTSTDHGFNLGHEPGAHNAFRELVVARYRADAHDWLLWNRLGQPQSYRYLYDPAVRSAEPRVVSFSIPASTRFEAEAEWPPLAVSGGWALPDYPSASCAGGSPGLRLVGPTRVTLALGVLVPGRYVVIPHWVATDGANAEVMMNIGGNRWSASSELTAGTCLDTPGPALELSGDFPIELETQSSALVLDAIDVRPAVPLPDGKKR